MSDQIDFDYEVNATLDEISREKDADGTLVVRFQNVTGAPVEYRNPTLYVGSDDVCRLEVLVSQAFKFTGYGERISVALKDRNGRLIDGGYLVDHFEIRHPNCEKRDTPMFFPSKNGRKYEGAAARFDHVVSAIGHGRADKC